MLKDKLAKRERVGILYEIDKTLINYCHVCPYFALNTPHPNCRKCPVDGILKEYGKQLGWTEDQNRPKKHVRWTDEEDYILRNSFGKMPVAKIARSLGRSAISVTKRIQRMREQGIL